MTSTLPSTKKDVLVVCGTRPEIIKMAPVYLELARSQTLRPVLLHTGQHTDLATPLYKFFGLGIDHLLELKRDKPTLARLSELLLGQCADVIEKSKPSAVLVHGDTSSAAMAALAAFYNQVPVGHVEAGLRTYDKYSPFPEEMNRSLIGRMADWHYAPTPRAAQALYAEGIAQDKVLTTGNTVIDAALWTAQAVARAVPDFVRDNQLETRLQGMELTLVTAHRRENWGEGLVQIAHAVADWLESNPKAFVVWPLHANPAVAQPVRQVLKERLGEQHPRLVLCEALDYVPLVWLLQHSHLVLTDSGGIQEEATAFGTPVLILRDCTERPEVLEAGAGVLVGASRERIGQALATLSANPAQLERMRHAGNPFGDGQAASRIVAHLEHVLKGA